MPPLKRCAAFSACNLTVYRLRVRFGPDEPIFRPALRAFERGGYGVWHGPDYRCGNTQVWQYPTEAANFSIDRFKSDHQARTVPDFDA